MRHKELVPREIRSERILGIEPKWWAITIVCELPVFVYCFFNAVVGILWVLFILAVCMTCGYFNADRHAARLAIYLLDKRKDFTFEDAVAVKQFSGPILETKRRQMAYFEVKGKPFRMAPYRDNLRRALRFCDQVMTVTEAQGSMTVFATKSAEKTDYLEERLNRMMDMPEHLRRIEDKRIEHHYYLSKSAHYTEYVTRIEHTLQKTEEPLEDLLVIEGPLLDGSLVQKRGLRQLTPDARIFRGKALLEEKVKAKSRRSDEGRKWKLPFKKTNQKEEIQ